MAKRIVIYLIGLSITALGSALVILSDVGTGPLDSAVVALNRIFGLTIGMWGFITQVIIIMIVMVIERRRPRLGSIVTLMIRSWILDIWFYLVLGNINLTSTWELQWFSFIMGTLALGIGIGIYMEAKFPRMPVDALMIAIHNRFKLSLNTSRVTIECLFALFGFILGGPVGIGTLIIAITLGRIIQLSNRYTIRLAELSEQVKKQKNEMTSRVEQ